jgi:hypothetical protein
MVILLCTEVDAMCKERIGRKSQNDDGSLARDAQENAAAI